VALFASIKLDWEDLPGGKYSTSANLSVGEKKFYNIGGSATQ